MINDLPKIQYPYPFVSRRISRSNAAVTVLGTRMATDFGIPNGFQPNQSECTFHYFRNVTSQGWIQSPNFPGAYPRLVLRVVYGTIEICRDLYVYFWAKRSLVYELAQQIRCHSCVLRTGRVNGSCHLCRIPPLCSSWSIFGLTLFGYGTS